MNDTESCDFHILLLIHNLAPANCHIMLSSIWILRSLVDFFLFKKTILPSRSSSTNSRYGSSNLREAPTGNTDPDSHPESST